MQELNRYPCAVTNRCMFIITTRVFKAKLK